MELRFPRTYRLLAKGALYGAGAAVLQRVVALSLGGQLPTTSLDVVMSVVSLIFLASAGALGAYVFGGTDFFGVNGHGGRVDGGRGGRDAMTKALVTGTGNRDRYGLDFDVRNDAPYRATSNRNN